MSAQPPLIDGVTITFYRLSIPSAHLVVDGVLPEIFIKGPFKGVVEGDSFLWVFNHMCAKTRLSVFSRKDKPTTSSKTSSTIVYALDSDLTSALLYAEELFKRKAKMALDDLSSIEEALRSSLNTELEHKFIGEE